MAFEINIGHRTANVEMLNKVNNKIQVAVDDKKYEVDIVMVEEGVYSLICNGISYNVELVCNNSCKNYTVNTFFKTFDIEIIDAESKYLKSRLKLGHGDDELVISTPMPGKVIKIMVETGDEVKEGQTVIVVEAMKMQSEYKVRNDRKIKEICVKEGDTVNAHQPLLLLE